ncbi:MAG: glycosyl hydrolase family 28-related protein [Paracoccaceae bacterium]
MPIDPVTGRDLNPPPFARGLDNWSRADGTSASPHWGSAPNAAHVPSDADFGGCVEIATTGTVTRLRDIGRTWLRPGQTLRVTARAKVLTGTPSGLRIAGTPLAANGAARADLPGTGSVTDLTAPGQVVEVSAILGTGARQGVDLAWPGVTRAHVGVDLVGTAGAVVRVDDITIEDVTAAFLPDQLGQVNVRDYGAVGDGSTDDAAAFERADSDARGRTVVVPEGTYRLGASVTMQSEVQFGGTLSMPRAAILVLQRNFDYLTYLDAFGDEVEAFKRAFQALLNFTDHDSLDLGGKRINVDAPIDMAAAVPNRTRFATRRVIRNGQFVATSSAAWSPGSTTRTARYAASNDRRLTDVSNAGAIEPGSLVTGTGVGREVYVTSVDASARTVTLSQPLWGAGARQSYTFTRFRYMLDFSGFEDLAQFAISDCEIQCSGHASGILLAPEGLTFALSDSFVTRPRDRGITSHGRGCQGMLIDRCQFLSNEQNLRVTQRKTTVLNANSNDVKLRDNRVVLFKNFAVLAGSGSIIVGNHWFHGDSVVGGVRGPGLIFTRPSCSSTVTGNYIDQNSIEMTNEHDATPNFASQFSFGGLAITGNIFMAINANPGFEWIVVRPFGSGHFVNGLSVVGNTFRSIGSVVTRVDGVNEAIASLNPNRMRGVAFHSNMYHGVAQKTLNPAHLEITRGSTARSWTTGSSDAAALPFRGWARFVDAVAPRGRIRNGGGGTLFDMPAVEPQVGSGNRQLRFTWSEPARGTLRYTVRADNPE